MRNWIPAFACVTVLSVLTAIASGDPLLRYTFDEDSSGSLPASDSGQAPPAEGAFQGVATRTANTPGGFSLGALDLSAANTYVTTADPNKLDGLGPLTLTAWVNLQGSPANGNRVMSKQVASGNFDGFSFAFSNPTAGTIAANNFRLNLALGGTGGFGFFVSEQNLDAENQWIFVAVTYNGTDAVTFYSGGDSAGALTGSVGGTLLAGVPTPGVLVGNDRDFRVGAQSEGTISAPVWIDDVRVYASMLDLAGLEAVRLTNLPTGSELEGDFNGDGKVDAADYVVWRKGLGTTHTPEQYNIWRTNFGVSSSGSGSLAHAAPEPTSLLLLVLCGVMFQALGTNRNTR